MSEVMHVETEELQTLLQQSGVLVVDFYADWCMPCKMMAPVIDKLAADYDGRLKVVKVNTDESPEAAEQYGVQSIPTIVVLKDGAVQSTTIGVQPYDALAEAVEKAL